ncbi:MAG TPA: ABC transporter ATP-binding protein [Candidatus Methanofastidiosa archaeon]|nr:ABC transporter ATP-binding protein [Candidatus Methanofastidiosa archaeon]
MLKIKDISNDWDGIFSLKGIDLHVREGEYFVILGPTGAGKTLLLEIIAGLYYPDEGSIKLRGKDVTTLPPEKRNVGFLYQDYSLFPNYDSRSNIEYGLKVRKLPKEEINRIVEALTSMLDIGHLLSRDVTTLSGGEQQKVAMARALAVRPDILLLDEPFSALDAATKEKLINDMKALHRREGITTIHVTHSQEEAMILADRIAIMMDGRIVQVGDPKEIFFKPVSVDVARFVKVENIWDVDIVDNSPKGLLMKLDGKEILTGQYTSPIGERARLLIRPEDIVIGSGELTSARNRFRGTISSMEYHGFFNLLRIDCGFPVVVAVTMQSINDMGLEVGSEVGVFFKSTALHVVPI